MTTHAKIMQAIALCTDVNRMRVGELATQLGMHIDDLNGVLKDLAKNKQIWHEKRVLDGMECWVVWPRAHVKMHAKPRKLAAGADTPSQESKVFKCLQALELNPQGLSETAIRDITGVNNATNFLRGHVGNGRVVVDRSVRPMRFMLADGYTAHSAWQAASAAIGIGGRFGETRKSTGRKKSDVMWPELDDDNVPVFIHQDAAAEEPVKLDDAMEPCDKQALQTSACSPKNLAADDFLKYAASIMAERGKQYDSQQGERSMDKTVQIFNLYTGMQLSESDGWLFMQILKDVRQWQKQDFHLDSAVDCLAYASLKAEALAKGN